MGARQIVPVGYRPSVLVVEDDLPVRSVIRNLLVAAGYSVCEAGSVKEGELVASSDVPDMMTLDLILPDGRGESLAESLATHSLLPSTLVVSIATDPTVKRRLSVLGVEDYIRKPFDVEDLVASVNNAMVRGLSRNIVRRAGLRFDVLGQQIEYRGARHAPKSRVSNASFLHVASRPCCHERRDSAHRVARGVRL